MIRTIINSLKENWCKQVNHQYVTQDEMVESITHLIAHNEHVMANESDELTDEYAKMMGYDINNMTGIQWHEWTSIVDAAGIQFLYENIEAWIPDDWCDTPHERTIMVGGIFNCMIRNSSSNYVGIADAAQLLGFCD